MLDELEWEGLAPLLRPLGWGATTSGRFAPALQAYERLTGVAETNINAVWHHRRSLYGPPLRGVWQAAPNAPSFLLRRLRAARVAVTKPSENLRFGWNGLVVAAEVFHGVAEEAGGLPERPAAHRDAGR